MSRNGGVFLDCSYSLHILFQKEMIHLCSSWMFSLSCMCTVCHCICACVCVCETQTVLHSGHFSTYQRQCEIEGHHLHSVAIVKADGGQLEWQLNPPHTFSPPSCFLMPHFLCSHLFIVVQSLTHVTDHLSISHVSTLGRTFCSVGLSEQICMRSGQLQWT